MKKLLLFLSLCLVTQYTSCAKRLLTPKERDALESKIFRLSSLGQATGLASATGFLSAWRFAPVFCYMGFGVSLATTARAYVLMKNLENNTKPLTFKDALIDSNEYVADKLGNTHFLSHFKN